jgi:tetratricopeptide (TPR) repeat protein
MSMREFFSKLAYRVLTPAALWLLIEKLLNPLLKPYWVGFESTLPALAELARFAALAGVASFAAEEVAKYAISPITKDVSEKQLVPALKEGFDKIREAIASALQERGIIIQGQPIMEKEHGNELEEALGKDPEMDPGLNKAKNLIIEGQSEKAIEVLEKLVAQKPDYKPHLASVLLSSPKSEDWNRARTLLSSGIGSPRNYLRLAYNYWTKGDLSNAIAILESGLRQVEQKQMIATPDELDRLRNSLAYYYADANLLDKGEEALRFSEEVVAHRIPQGESKSLGLALATRGYVKITFGNNRDQIIEGIKDCEDGRRMGASEDLFFKNLARAQGRLAKLS